MNSAKKSVFQDRFVELVGSSATQEEIAKKANTSRQNVGNWINGKSRPDINALVEIAKGYDVSTDWLLGLTNIKSADTDIKAVCEYTGLSEEAIRQLTSLNRSGKTKNTLDTLLTNPSFFLLLVELMSLDIFSSMLLENIESDTKDIMDRDRDSDLCRYKTSELMNDIMDECFDNRKIYVDTFTKIQREVMKRDDFPLPRKKD